MPPVLAFYRAEQPFQVPQGPPARLRPPEPAGNALVHPLNALGPPGDLRHLVSPNSHQATSTLLGCLKFYLLLICNYVLSWTAPDDDSVTGYRILRRRPREGENTLLVYVSDTGNTATTNTGANAATSNRYVYRVKAINPVGIGHWSNYARVDK